MAVTAARVRPWKLADAVRIRGRVVAAFDPQAAETDSRSRRDPCAAASDPLMSESALISFAC
ncbi:MAG: hypothetical protein VKI81_07175, partial [Synechococcaceae cyanobacterium]|nr:hypothetical protein [Synechococcaceae cyanobacterium]